MFESEVSDLICRREGAYELSPTRSGPYHVRK